MAFQEPLEEVRPLGDQQLDVAEVHRCARRSILGLRVTATYEAMYLGQRLGLSHGFHCCSMVL